MRTILKFLVLVYLLPVAVARADCLDRVADARAQVQRDVARLSDEQQTRLTTILLELCGAREPGSSVVVDEDRTVYTTRDLQHQRKPSEPAELNAIIEIDHRDRGRRRATE